MKSYYATLIKHGDGVMLRLMTQEIVNLIKQYNGAAVLAGYDQKNILRALSSNSKKIATNFRAKSGGAVLSMTTATTC